MSCVTGQTKYLLCMSPVIQALLLWTSDAAKVHMIGWLVYEETSLIAGYFYTPANSILILEK